MSTESMSANGNTVYALEGFPAAAVRFVRALERNRELIALDHGVTASELAALFHIGEVAKTTPKELAHHLRMTTGAITAISGRIVSAGLILRVDHPRDRRSLYLELTPQGHDVMSRIHREFTSMIAESTAGLTPAQLADFEVSLMTVSEQIVERTER